MDYMSQSRVDLCCAKHRVNCGVENRYLSASVFSIEREAYINLYIDVHHACIIQLHSNWKCCDIPSSVPVIRFFFVMESLVRGVDAVLLSPDKPCLVWIASN